MTSRSKEVEFGDVAARGAAGEEMGRFHFGDELGVQLPTPSLDEGFSFYQHFVGVE